mmetsp:Transcript_39183/g.75108  ORF Transcript_39183/g.75108 Transcript_39183/m.75108 type:complete len:194 (+) Transcript_39183:110-691(+)
MSTRAQASARAVSQVFQGRVRQWTQKWVTTGPNERVKVLKWVQGESSFDRQPPEDRISQYEPVRVPTNLNEETQDGEAEDEVQGPAVDQADEEQVHASAHAHQDDKAEEAGEGPGEDQDGVRVGEEHAPASAHTHQEVNTLSNTDQATGEEECQVDEDSRSFKRARMDVAGEENAMPQASSLEQATVPGGQNA